MKTKLTTTEKFVIAGALAKQDTKIDWKEVYKAAHPERPETKNLASIASKWKLSQLVTDYINELQALEADKAKRLKEEGKREYIEEEKKRRRRAEEAETEEGKKETFFDGSVDFTDKDQFINYLNNQANTITDPKLKTDYIKMLSDLLRFKEDKPEREEENQIQRFYIPVTCQNCKLYQDQKQKTVE